MQLLDFLLPAKNSCEQREQMIAIYDNLRRQIPLLYASAIVNLIGMHVAIGGSELSFYSAVTVLSGLLVWRTIFWTFLQKPTQSHEKVQSELIGVVLFTVVLCAGFSIWAQLLISRHPDLTLAIILFNILAALGAAYGLSSFPRAAVLPLAILGFPVAVRLLFTGDNLTQAMGLSLLLVILLFMRLLQTHGHALSGLVSSRMAVAREHNRAISAEVAALKRADEDGLTGLANRARLIREMGRNMVPGPSSGGGSVLAICDLDGFKPANDVFGHAAGDAILKVVAERLVAAFKDQALVARLGGDEFAIFWSRGLARNEILARGASICEIVRQPIEWDGKKLVVGLSCGITEAGPHTTSIAEFMRQADSALYNAKASGRGRFQLYDEVVFSIDKRKASLERLLISLEASNELTVEYQPIMMVENGKAVYAEALARWRSAELGDVAPYEFIHLAERIGRIEQISEVLLKKALRGARGWPDDIRLSFNLSATQVSRPGAAARILQTVCEQDFPPSRMLFEVTETAVLTDFETAKQELQALRDAGSLVALDDFGAGHASVSYLRDLVFDVVKLDGSLTTSIQECARSRQILLGLINLCHAAGALCVAEHVETPGQLALLKAMGCDLAQGFYLGRPVSSGDLASLPQFKALAASASNDSQPA
ncbi:EAL domain-containing protein [Erythrobacter sp. NFXS35]|uniref:putative bifunctional diguanylate cyclase/phosphodiesterase n=1 Tax=Erythrobacter sp. NFXS35 TaxID=2818436 RepID=UPI0032DF91DE